MWHARSLLPFVQALYNKDFSVEANRKDYIKNQNKMEKKLDREEEKTSNDRGTSRGGGCGSGGGQANVKTMERR